VPEKRVQPSGRADITCRNALQQAHLAQLNLQAGDVVKLPNTKVNSEMVIRIGGRKKYKCRPGLIGSRLAVQVGEKIEDIPDELLTSKRSEDEL